MSDVSLHSYKLIKLSCCDDFLFSTHSLTNAGCELTTNNFIVKVYRPGSSRAQTKIKKKVCLGCRVFELTEKNGFFRISYPSQNKVTSSVAVLLILLVLTTRILLFRQPLWHFLSPWILRHVQMPCVLQHFVSILCYSQWVLHVHVQNSEKKTHGNQDYVRIVLHT